ncbi:hypothetical protein AMS68_004605 [Peltaster fructicola]|uniref:Uncharacterized protein n=1 Tax=Peltaster fructicola TaxID=286661 RepID=A0A6H0XWW3_9PEZI|nr:hypothetical protein AMS68_004605 [Peltaster fructicola]
MTDLPLDLIDKDNKAMAMDLKRMGVYSLVPSKYQSTDQFRNLGGALVSPPHQTVLVPGREDGLTDFARAAKRRKILALADDVLHGRTLFISSAAREPHALRALVQLRLKERHKKWRTCSKSASTWQDLDNTWDVLRKVCAHRHRQGRSATLERSPGAHKSVGMNRNAANREESVDGDAKVIDETVLVDEMDCARSETVDHEYKLAHGTTHARQPHKSRSRQAARNSRPGAQNQKRRAVKSRIQQHTLTKTYRESRVSSQTSTNAKDEEAVEDHPSLSLHVGAIKEAGRPPVQAQPGQVQSRKSESSPFVFHRRKSRAGGPSGVVVLLEHSTALGMATIGGAAETVAAGNANPESEARASLVTEHLNKLLPVSPASGKTSSSVTKALRQALRRSGADISFVDDVPQPPLVTQQVVLGAGSPHCEEASDVPRRESLAWRGTQALIAEAHEALFDPFIDQSVLPLQPDEARPAHDVGMLADDGSGHSAAPMAAPETQDILDGWSPWSADKTQQRKALNRASMGSMASPTVDPMDVLKSHRRTSSTRRTKDVRSSLCFSLDAEYLVDQTDNVPHSRWTAVNQTDAETNRHEIDLFKKPNMTTSRELSGSQAAQVHSIDATRAELDMDQCITDIALDFFGSSTPTTRT